LRKSVILFTLLFVLLALPMFSVPRVAGAITFGTPQALELSPGASSYPSSLQASDGTLWVAWQQYYETGEYMTYTAARGWSVIQTLPTGTQFVLNPSFEQLRNSSMILLWSSNQTGRWNLFYKLYSNGAWRNTIQLTSGSTFDDFFPEAAVSTNSTVYLFWERFFSSTSSSIYYKTLKGDTWSGDIQLSSNNVDVTPTAVATFDGNVRVAFSRQNAANYNVIYRTYNGVAWSAETVLTTNSYDIDPNMVQDRNGTIWAFFSRQIQLSSGSNAVYEQKLFYKNTIDGTTWSADTQLTSYGDVNNPLDDLSPSVVQGADKTLWIFYSSDYPFGSEFDIYYIKSSSISSVHNVVITQVQSGPYVFQKTSATVLVTVTNLGDFSENILLTITATNLTSYTIAISVSKTLPIGSTQIFSFGWNTTGIPQGRYVITVTYPRLTGQSLLASGGDTLQFKVLTILPPIKIGGCHNFRDCPT
jgi:hypothetical protein